ncbi:hypothetical protein HUK65_10995 [Rhodobacteraceae bacterium 2376]|uniref:Uncharacterized protein n=1 Tax=Rhabdonatronobacter sediminivivens TaxID=2743469 RepID=A0A7Z0KYN3_9RHOB|nr:hypothetical protein [Rhabdonatronobacter sediminivivens]
MLDDVHATSPVKESSMIEHGSGSVRQEMRNITHMDVPPGMSRSMLNFLG